MRSVITRLEKYFQPGEFQRKQQEMATKEAAAKKQLSDELEDFLQTSVGQFLVQNIEKDKKLALQQLTTVSPHDYEAILDIQTKYHVANKIYEYISKGLANRRPS